MASSSLPGWEFQRDDNSVHAVVSNGRLDLVGVAERMRRVGVKGVETSVWYGSPVKGITDPARFRKPELIVMSTTAAAGSAG